MATQEEFLDLLWADINLTMQEHWIDNNIRASEKDPDAPFADVGPALKRLLALGASRRDLSLLRRHASYEEAFNVLYLLNDPGIDDNEIEGIHESVLAADPSGQEGRPGSAPPLQTGRRPKPGGKKQKSLETKKPKPGKRKILKSSQEVCFSSDGTLLATLGRGLSLWICPEIELVAKISTISNPCEISFSPDSRLLAVKNMAGRITLIDASTQGTTCDFRNQTDGHGSKVVFADDGKHVIDASHEGDHFVRTLDGKITFREVFKGDMVTDVLRHPDGTYWFRHKRPDERLIGRTWPFKQGDYEVMTIPVDCSFNPVAFSPDGRFLAVTVGLEPRIVTLLSFPSMKKTRSAPIPSLGRGACYISFSPCGRLLAVVGDAVAVLNANTLEVIEEIPIEYGADVAFSPTDSLMAVGSSSVGEVFDTTRFLNAIAT